MRSSLSFAVLSLLATLSLASNQLNIYLPGVGTSYAMNASVSTANPTATILVIPCPTSGPNDLLANEDCPSNGIVYSIISTTIYRAIVGSHVTFACKHKTSDREMSCDYVVADVSAWKQTYTDWEFVTATVTAGAESLSQFRGDGNGGTASATASGMDRASGTAKDSNANQNSQTTRNSGSRTTMYAPSETPGAAYKYGIEGSALLALAGAAALNAW